MGDACSTIQNIGDEQTADKVDLELVVPHNMLYGLRVTYKTGTQVCEVNVPVQAIRIQGEKPEIQLYKADSSCK